MTRILLLPLLLFSFRAYAEKPAWVSKLPTPKDGYSYFVGRSSAAPSEVEAVKLAEKDAKEQLIKKHFGTLIKLNTQVSESLTEVSVMSKLNEESDIINLKGFESDSVYSEKDGNGTVVWALFKCPKADIDAEVKRIKKEAAEKLAAAKIKPDSKSLEQSEAAYIPDNQGFPKIKENLKKSEVLRLFGKPDDTTKSYNGVDFHYKDKPFCKVSINQSYCYVYFVRDRVSHYSDFKTDYTYELEDEGASAPVPRRQHATAPDKTELQLAKTNKIFYKFQKKCTDFARLAPGPWDEWDNKEDLIPKMCLYLLNRAAKAAGTGQLITEKVFSSVKELVLKSPDVAFNETLKHRAYSYGFFPYKIIYDQTSTVIFPMHWSQGPSTALVKLYFSDEQVCVHVRLGDVMLARATGKFIEVEHPEHNLKPHCMSSVKEYKYDLVQDLKLRDSYVAKENAEAND